MSGETDLSCLLRRLSPALQPGEFVFCSVDETTLARLDMACIHGLFRETQGITVIVLTSYATRMGLAGEGPFCCITCEVHSSLSAVGLTAAIATRLTAVGVSANVVAAYHHDHIFVPVSDVSLAVQTLKALSAAY